VNWVGLEHWGLSVGMVRVLSTGIGASRGSVMDQSPAFAFEGLPRTMLTWLSNNQFLF
jgi:hypothetical protein